MKVQTDEIISRTGQDAVSFLDGATGGTPGGNGKFIVTCTSTSFTGISTFGILNVNNNSSISGIATALFFQGGGQGLTNVTSISIAKSYALKLIISDPPLRS